MVSKALLSLSKIRIQSIALIATGLFFVVFARMSV